MLVDGQRIHGACPNRMDPAAFHVDVAEVDRVEIARGPFDVRHQGSLAGLPAPAERSEVVSCKNYKPGEQARRSVHAGPFRRTSRGSADGGRR